MDDRYIEGYLLGCMRPDLSMETVQLMARLDEHATDPDNSYTSTGVYFSRHQPDLKSIPGYGAMIIWELDEKAIYKSRDGKHSLPVIIKSELRRHDDAPEITGARGKGRWVYECLCTDTNTIEALSAAQLHLP